MFEKTLKDIARGLLELPDESMKQIYVARVLQEIKKEISLTDMALKSNAILKLIYLHILGYDMDWAVIKISLTLGIQHNRNNVTSLVQNKKDWVN